MTEIQSSQPAPAEVKQFIAAMKRSHPNYPRDYWIQPDGQVCWKSAGTEHAWRGWQLHSATAGAQA